MQKQKRTYIIDDFNDLPALPGRRCSFILHLGYDQYDEVTPSDDSAFGRYSIDAARLSNVGSCNQHVMNNRHGWHGCC
jgi:hypothetical protein